MVDDDEVTRVETPTARDKHASIEPPPPSSKQDGEDEPTIRRPSRLPKAARVTLPSRSDFDRRALPFVKPDGRRQEVDPPLELAETVQAPSSSSLELPPVLADPESEPPASDSPWSSFGIDREALPSSMAPPPVEDPEEAAQIQRAKRATVILWVAVAAVVVITLVAMLWT